MILALDIGNTNIVIGGIDNGKIAFLERLSTDKTGQSSEYAIKIKSLLDLKGIPASDFDGAIVSSVVPPVDFMVRRAIKMVLNVEPIFVTINSDHGLVIETEPVLGNDLITGAVAALAEYKPPMVIVDLGTATTISVIGKNSHFLGVSIMAGLKLSQQALSNNAAQLPAISMDTPKVIIGKNTPDAMKSGLLIGTAAMIDGMVDRIEKELGEPVTIITTGGFSAVITQLLTKDAVCDPNLIMKGLWILYNKLK